MNKARHPSMSGGKSRSRRSRSRRGGAGNVTDYGSASNWMESTVGNGNTQWNNVFNQNDNKSVSDSNAIRGLQGQVAGSRRRRSARRSRKGGFWSEVVKQAIVPFTLLGLQQTYAKRRHLKKGGTRKHRR